MLAIGMGVNALGSLLQPFSTGLLMTTGLMCVTAVGQSVAWPNVGALISRTADPHRQGQILGLNNAAGAFARFVGPLSAGLTFASISINAPFYPGRADRRAGDPAGAQRRAPGAAAQRPGACDRGGAGGQARAIDATGARPDTAEERRALIVLLSVIFLMIAGFGLVIPLLPFFAKAFNAPAWQVTLLFSAFSFGQFLGEPFWGGCRTGSGASRC